ncbi:hypothetical protein [Ferrimicrobium acidiphilum]|uniref:hypothetical protein n=1 Tax=Ferrimicrobium acidiphilum TaxID=121039 RepID=UPI0023F124DF|nr:hypothetical protein [Ferrimicrobium acidiphilum]
MNAATIFGHSTSQFLNTDAHAYPEDLRGISELLALIRSNRGDYDILSFRYEPEQVTRGKSAAMGEQHFAYSFIRAHEHAKKEQQGSKMCPNNS